MDTVTPPSPAPAADAAAHAFFKQFNRWFMIPVHRAGLGAWVGTPFGGYMLLLRVRGRKTGATRETPLSYTIMDGAAWVAAGFGERTQWLRNLLADPDAEILLPGREPLAVRAEVVHDEAVRAHVMPALMRATGAPALMSGANPWRGDDAALMAALPPMPLVRLVPVDGSVVTPGEDDPGGRAWVWRQGVMLFLTVLVLRLAARTLTPARDGR